MDIGSGFSDSLNVGDQLDVGIPQMETRDFYLLHLLKAMERFDYCVLQATNLTDPRPRLLARGIVTRIPDDKVREELLKRFDDEVKEIRKKQSQDLNNEEKGEAIIIISQNILAQVYSNIDQDLGIRKRLFIGKL